MLDSTNFTESTTYFNTQVSPTSSLSPSASPTVTPSTFPSPQPTTPPPNPPTQLNPVSIEMNKLNAAVGHRFANEVMIFVGIGATDAENNSLADYVSGRISQITSAGYKPLVVVEPSNSTGLISFNELATGAYDIRFKYFMNVLKSKGITNESIGSWVLLPEPNVPSWNKTNFDNKDFGLIFNRLSKIVKMQFPRAKTTVLFDAKSYESNDTDWANGKKVSFAPYLTKVNTRLLDSIGLQAFPWYSPNGVDKLTDPKDFMPTNLITEASQLTGVKNIWINTGIVHQYKSSSGAIVTVPFAERIVTMNTLQGILGALPRNNMKVSVNLFMEEKLSNEGRNFQFQTPEEQKKLSSFVYGLERRGLSFSVKY